MRLTAQQQQDQRVLLARQMMLRRQVEMSLTPARVRAANVTVSTRWQMAFMNTPIWWMQIANREPSDAPSNIYAFQNALGIMKRRGQGPVFRDVSAQAFEVFNDDWDDGIKIPKNELSDDRLKIYLRTVDMLGNRAAKWPDQQIARLIINGTTGLCFDGKPFFATDHPIDPTGMVTGTWGNLSTLGGAGALSETSYSAARAAMAVFPDQANQPLGVVPTILAVPPALRTTAKKIVNATLVGGGNTNVLQNDVEVLEIPELAAGFAGGSDTAWYLFAQIGGVLPFGWQDRESPILIPKTNPTDDNVFFDKELLYLIDARGEFFYALPYLAYKTPGA